MVLQCLYLCFIKQARNSTKPRPPFSEHGVVARNYDDSARGEVPRRAHCPRPGACNWRACSPALPAQLHPGCYLLSTLWWSLSSVRAALIGLTRRPRVWRCRLVRGTKASTARSATNATGVAQRSSCAPKHGSFRSWLGVVMRSPYLAF